MLLGALVDAGVPLETLQARRRRGRARAGRLRCPTVERHGIGAIKVDVHAAGSSTRRTWADSGAAGRAPLTEPVQDTALDAFARLARRRGGGAPGRPRGRPLPRGRRARRDRRRGRGRRRSARARAGPADRRPGALGSGGTARSGHGVSRSRRRPCSAPRRGGRAGPRRTGPDEMCTPTGAALLAAAVTGWGPLPRAGAGVGVGRRRARPGRAAERGPAGARRPPSARRATAVVLETNVDDLDPRLWPDVLDRLLAAGAERRLAHPDPDEEGPPGPHPARALSTRDGRRRSGPRSSGVPARSGSDRSRSARPRSTGTPAGSPSAASGSPPSGRCWTGPSST